MYKEFRITLPTYKNEIIFKSEKTMLIVEPEDTCNRQYTIAKSMLDAFIATDARYNVYYASINNGAHSLKDYMVKANIFDWQPVTDATYNCTDCVYASNIEFFMDIRSQSDVLLFIDMVKTQARNPAAVPSIIFIENVFGTMAAWSSKLLNYLASNQQLLAKAGFYIILATPHTSYVSTIYGHFLNVEILIDKQWDDILTFPKTSIEVEPYCERLLGKGACEDCCIGKVSPIRTSMKSLLNVDEDAETQHDIFGISPAETYVSCVLRTSEMPFYSGGIFAALDTDTELDRFSYMMSCRPDTLVLYADAMEQYSKYGTVRERVTNINDIITSINSATTGYDNFKYIVILGIDQFRDLRVEESAFSALEFLDTMHAACVAGVEVIMVARDKVADLDPTVYAYCNVRMTNINDTNIRIKVLGTVNEWITAPSERNQIATIMDGELEYIYLPEKNMEDEEDEDAEED